MDVDKPVLLLHVRTVRVRTVKILHGVPPKTVISIQHAVEGYRKKGQF